jgi:hypothetical protein
VEGDVQMTRGLQEHLLRPDHDHGEEYAFGLDLILDGLERAQRIRTACHRLSFIKAEVGPSKRYARLPRASRSPSRRLCGGLPGVVQG